MFFHFWQLSASTWFPLNIFQWTHLSIMCRNSSDGLTGAWLLPTLPQTRLGPQTKQRSGNLSSSVSWNQFWLVQCNSSSIKSYLTFLSTLSEYFHTILKFPWRMITNDEPGSEPESHTHHQADNIQSLRFDNFFYVWSSTIVKCCVYLYKSVDCDCGWVLLLCCASLQLFPPRMFAEHNWMHITCADLFCIRLSPAQP